MWDNGGSNTCWAPYSCTGSTCTPVGIYDGCFDSGGGFHCNNQQDASASVGDCGSARTFVKDGESQTIEPPLETRKGVVAVQGGGGAIAGAGVLGALLFARAKRSKKRAPAGVENKGVEVI